MSSNVAVCFEQNLFVNRDKAKQEFLHIIHSKTPRIYLEFNAVAGQGKSELLKWIYHNSQNEEYYAAYIDFELARYHQPEIYPLLETIATHLSEQIDSDLFLTFKEKLPFYFEEARKFYSVLLHNHQTPKPPGLQEVEHNLFTAFHESLNSLLTWRRIVLCLDSTEKAYSQTLRAFEEYVLRHYTKHHNFMLVTAGQEKLVWQNAEIQHKVKLHKLLHLEPKWAHKQVETLARVKNFRIEDSDLVLEKMLQLTLGHPFSNYKLLDFWTDGFNSPLNTTVVEKRFAPGIKQLIGKVLEERILERTRLGEMYPSAKKILWYLAPLRHIELSMFRYVLSTFLDDWFKGKPFTFFERLIGQFQNTYIFTRWQLGSGFDIEPVVRNLLLWDMRENVPEFFLEITENLEQTYNARVEQTHEASQIKNVIERLYHYATYLKITQPNYVKALVNNELQHYLDTYFTIEFTGDEIALREQLNRLYSALEYNEELTKLIDIQDLLEMIRQRMGED